MTTCLFLPTCVALDEPGPVVSVGIGTSTGLSPPGAKTADVDDVSSSVYAAVKVHDDNDDADTDDAMVLGVEAVRRRRDEKVSLLGGEGGRSGSSSDDESVSDGAVLRKS